MLLVWLQRLTSDPTLRLIWNTFNTQTHSIYAELTADRGVPAWVKYNFQCIQCAPLKRDPNWNALDLDSFHVWFSICWVSSLCGEADGNKGLRVSGWVVRFNFCCSVLFYDLKGADWVCWGGFFCFPGQLWRWGPLSPQGHNSTNECLVVGSEGGLSTHKKVSGKLACYYLTVF